ncbi:hypothetical protein V6N13_139971 [Hibiscus sabdariffa]
MFIASRRRFVSWSTVVVVLLHYCIFWSSQFWVVGCVDSLFYEELSLEFLFILLTSTMESRLGTLVGCIAFVQTLVEKVWTSDSGHLISKLSKVGMELRKWSKYHKAKSKKYYESLKARLEELVDDDPDDEKLAELLDVEIALNMEAEKEELLESILQHKISPPVSESLKFNFDASFNSFEKRSTSSIIIRDSSGQPMAASTFPQLFTRDPEMTEAKACEQAVLLARDLGFRKVIIEGDALNVINKLNNHVEDRPDIGAIVKNIQDVRKQFQNISFVHVSRRCNRVAHTLVKDYGTSTTQMVWIEEVPIYVEEAAEDDRWWVRPLDY